MNDPRFGLTGQSEPLVCAVTGQPARGRHLNSYSLVGGGLYYCLAKAIEKWTPELHAQLQADFTALMTPKVSHAAPSQDTPVSDAPQKKGK